MHTGKFDKTFFFATVALLLSGFFIFLSASLGLLAREQGSFSHVVIKQGLVGVIVGIAVLLATTLIDYRLLKKYALWIFIGALFLNLLVFIPGIGFEHGGALRWISVGSFSFQPSELLRLGTIIFFAAWLATVKDKVTTLRSGFLPLCIVVFLTEGVLLLQRDTDVVITLALVGMFFTAGGRVRHLAALAVLLVFGLTVLVFSRPYIMDRITTFLNPANDALGAGYQLQQSLIAIGSGGVMGRGLGQSIQKFNYLPEPVGDSIYAVAAEEFGFIGAVALIGLFLLWGFRGFRIAAASRDTFGTLLAVGIVLLIVGQAFTNIGAMVGVVPLTGVPLPFVSQGGTSILIALFSSGLVVSISKERPKHA